MGNLFSFSSCFEEERDICFTQEELDELQLLTYFDHYQIIALYYRWRSYAPAAINKNRNVVIEFETVYENFGALRNNPFRDRIMEIFCESPDGMNFEEYVNMMSTLSLDSAVSLRKEIFFQIFDFDNDDKIGIDDIEQIIQRLKGPLNIPLSLRWDLILELLEEVDLNDDDFISYPEFDRACDRSPHFVRSSVLNLDLCFSARDNVQHPYKPQWGI